MSDDDHRLPSTSSPSHEFAVQQQEVVGQHNTDGLGTGYLVPTTTSTSKGATDSCDSNDRIQDGDGSSLLSTTDSPTSQPQRGHFKQCLAKVVGCLVAEKYELICFSIVVALFVLLLLTV